jgi:beta-lactamase regulating signal transducer with metallopeptidase domain
MILTDAVLNAYINANIMLIFAFALWKFIQYTNKKLKFQLPYIFQLRLLNGVFLAIALSPFAIGAIAVSIQLGLLSPDFSMSVSDIAVAQYLNGSIEMKAVEFERMLGIRNTFMQNVLSLNTPTGFSITALFSIGFIAILARSIINIFKLRSVLRASYAWRQFGNLKIRLSDTTFIPFSTRSLNTRYVVIPSGMLAENEDLKMALGHELQHIRQGDVEWAFILEALRPFFFWNPVFYFWKRQVQQLRELACDQQLVLNKHFDIQAYCECLLKVCKNSIRKEDSYSIALPAVPFVQVENTPLGLSAAASLKHRIIAMVEPATTPISRKAFACLLLPAMALVILMSLAIQKPGDWSQDRLMLSTIVNLERMESRATAVHPSQEPF